MNAIDTAVVALYFLAMIGLGFWYQRRASKSLEHYFLGGKQIHWLALAMSGSVSNFDITGTMWIVALITLFGVKSMWNHWMWGFLMGAFFMAYMGKWIRRSGVMTGAEWMVTRFGPGREGLYARTAYALIAVVTTIGFVGYAFQGIGKFASIYIDLPPAYCAIGIFAITTTYVLLGGLYSVVVTDVLQTIILGLASVVIMAIAFTHVSAEQVAGSMPSDWASLTPPWRLDADQMQRVQGTGYEVYELFGLMLVAWLVKGVLLNLGGPAQLYDFQRFLAARDPRDASKVGAAWSCFLVLRWGMAMGIAVLAIVGFQDTQDPEQVMPLVLQEHLPVGVRGVVIAGLLAAFMSTFSSTVNSGASYVVKDLYEPLAGPDSDQRLLMRLSYAATVGLVVLGSVVGLYADSIRAVYDWIMGALGAAFMVPNVLRWYWWRLNGYGYAIGTLAGLVASLATPFFDVLAPLYASFAVVSVVSLVGTIGGTLATRPTDRAVLVRFFETIRPFGFWGVIRRECAAAGVAAPRSESLGLATLNVLLGVAAIGSAYLGPMYLVGHAYARAGVCCAVVAACVIALKFTWYDNLPAHEPPADSSPG